MALTWYRHFQRNGSLNQILQRQTPRFHYGWKVPVVTITAFWTILRQNRYNSSQRSISMKIHHLLSSLQNGLIKRSSSCTIWFQMRCWMTSCLNHDYLILVFIHFFVFTSWKSIVYYRLCPDRMFVDKILVSENKLFKRSNKANLFIALVQ